MKTRFLSPLLGMILCLALTACGGRKDADILSDIDKQRAGINVQGLTATATDGVVTLTGVANDEAGKAGAASTIAGIKGVKKVVNSITVAPAPPPAPAPSVEITPDDSLKQSVTDAIKDYPGVMAVVNDGIITLSGDIKRTDLQRLMQSLNTLKPKKIENKLIIK